VEHGTHSKDRLLTSPTNIKLGLAVTNVPSYKTINYICKNVFSKKYLFNRESRSHFILVLGHLVQTFFCRTASHLHATLAKSTETFLVVKTRSEAPRHSAERHSAERYSIMLSVAVLFNVMLRVVAPHDLVK